MSESYTTKQWVSFKLGREIYAVPVLMVQEIVPYEEPSPVPGAPDEVEGVLNIRGEVVSVISSHKLLNLQPKPPEYGWRIFVLEMEDARIGLLVEVVGDIVMIDPEHIEVGAHSTKAKCIVGTAQYDKDLIILVDMLGAVEWLTEPR